MPKTPTLNENIRGLSRRVHAALRVESRILVWAAVIAFGLVLFIHLASEIAEGETMAFDRAILLGLRVQGRPWEPIGPRWLLDAMTQITALGGGTVLTLMTGMVAAYLFAARRPATALFLIGAVAGGAILGWILKGAYERARPEIVTHLVTVSSASFPSGHALNSTVTYLTLGTLLAKTERRRAVRIYLISAAILLAVLIGFSRIYLGVHWPTDVVAGWCIGSIWALACSLIAEHLQQRRALEPRGSGAIWRS
jgi:undecaprenyl-diphosphatase